MGDSYFLLHKEKYVFESFFILVTFFSFHPIQGSGVTQGRGLLCGAIQVEERVKNEVHCAIQKR